MGAGDTGRKGACSQGAHGQGDDDNRAPGAKTTVLRTVCQAPDTLKAAQSR